MAGCPGHPELSTTAHCFLTALFIFPALAGEAGCGCAGILLSHPSCLPGKACNVSLSLKNIVVIAEGQTLIYATSVDLATSGFNILLGTTLAGKTTLMQVMAGLLKPAEGEIWFKGQNVTGMPVQKRNVSMVYQQFINYPNMTVFENIASPLRVLKTPTKVIRERVGPVAEMLKLSPFLDRKPAELSGGQQQRCAMARALVKDSDLVLLDEPLANLDYKLREELRDELPRIFAETGAIFVYATTEPQEALLLGGDTATLHEGRVTQFGRTIDVHNRPTDLLTAQTFSDPPMNIIAMAKRGSKLHFSGTSFACPDDVAGLADGTYNIGVRPHHLRLEKPKTRSIKLEAPVSTTEIAGSETFVHVANDSLKLVVLTHGVHQVDIGENVPVYLDPARLFVFDAQNLLVSAPIAESGG